MGVTLLRAGVCAILMLPTAALADKTFTAPSGWTQVVSAAPGAARIQEVWKMDTGPASQVLSVLTDPATSYADVLAAVRANVAAGGMKLTLDQDRMCDGRPAHTFEMVFGPDEKKSIANQTVITTGTGSMRITYTRARSDKFSGAVRSAIDGYCGPATP
jgi:hypothetical protein